MSCKVSIIVPVYNVEKYLRYCLDSILSQTMTDFEVICVDDGSPDNSLAILREYAAKDARFKVLTQANQGVAAARNAALDQATGDYIHFMDPDDAYPAPDALQKLYDAALLSNAPVVAGSLTGIIEEGAPNMNFEAHSFTKEQLVKYSDDPQCYFFQRFLFKRETLGSIRFPLYRRYQDPPFLVKALMTAGCFYTITAPVYWYRQRPAHVTYTPDRILCLVNGGCDILEMTADKTEYAALHDLYENRFFGDFSEEIAVGTLCLKMLVAGDKDITDRLIRTTCGDGRFLPPLQKILGEGAKAADFPPEYFESTVWKRKVRRFEFCRKVRGFFTCLAENGLSYTLKRLFVH